MARGDIPDFCLGLDLGQANDFTAISLIETPVWVEYGWTTDIRSPLLNLGQTGWVRPSDMTPKAVRAARHAAFGLPAIGSSIGEESHIKKYETAPLYLRDLERFPLGTSYPKIVGEVVSLLDQSPLRGHETALVIDFTGVGRAVFDLFVRAGLDPIGVNITGGLDVRPTAEGYNVPKRDLVAAARAALQTQRLQIAETLPQTRTLVRELLAFTMTINKRGHDQYGGDLADWREKEHDDLVFVTSLAVWYVDRLLAQQRPGTMIWDRWGRRVS